LPFEKCDKLSHLFRLNKHIYAEASEALHSKHTFVLVSFYWPRQDTNHFYEEIALSLEYDIIASGKLRRGVLMSTRERGGRATAFKQYDLRVTVTTKSGQSENHGHRLHVMVIGLQNLQALLCATGAFNENFWHNGPKLRRFNHIFQYKSIPGSGSAYDGNTYNEHSNKMKIMQCFKEHWQGFSYVKIRGIRGALKQQAEKSLTARHLRSSKEMLNSWKTTYESGMTHWKNLEFEEARLCMRQVYDDISTAYAIHNIQELSHDDHLRTRVAIDFFYPASLAANAGLCLHMSILRFHEDPPRSVYLLMCSIKYARMSNRCLYDLYTEEYGIENYNSSDEFRATTMLYSQLAGMEQLRYEIWARSQSRRDTRPYYRGCKGEAIESGDFDLLHRHEDICDSRSRLEIPIAVRILLVQIENSE